MFCFQDQEHQAQALDQTAMFTSIALPTIFTDLKLLEHGEAASA